MADKSTSPQTAPRSRPRWGRWLAIATGAVVLALTVGVLLLPTLVSTGPGKRALFGVIGASIPGNVAADDIDLNWFGGQSVSGLRLWDPAGELVAEVGQVRAANLRLLPLAFGSRELGVIELSNWELNLTQQPGQPTNLEQALFQQAPSREAPPETQPKEPGEPREPINIQDLSAQVRLTAGRVTYESPGIEPVELSDVNATLNMADPRQIGLTLVGDLRQGGEVGRIDADVQLADAFTADGRSQFDAAAVNARADLTNLPVLMVDRLAQQDGQLAALLGESLNAHVQAQGPVNQLNATVQAQSPHLFVDAQLVSEQGQLRASGSTFRLEITPDAYASFAGTPGSDPAAQTRLLEPFTVNVQLDGFVLPRTAEGIDLENAQIDLTATAGDIVFDVPERGVVALRNASADVNTRKLSELLEAQLSAVAEIGGVTEPVRAQLAARNLLGEQAPLQLTLTTEAVPVPLLDVAAQTEGQLARLLGDTLAAHVDLTRNPAGDLAFTGNVQTPLLQAPFTGGYASDGLMSFQTPSPAQLLIQPDAFADWVGEEGQPEPMILVEPMRVQLNVQDFQLAVLESVEPTDGSEAPLRIDAQRSRLFANLAVPTAVFRNPQTNEQVRAEQIQLDIAGENLSDVLNILMNLQIPQPTAAPPEGAIGSPAPGAIPGAGAGSVSSQTQVRGLVSATGELQPAAAQIQSTGELQRVPSMLIDALLGQGGTLAAVLGATTSADLNVAYNPGAGGQATFDLNAVNTIGRIAATIDSAGLVHLSEPATLRVQQVTPQLSDLVLQKINPLLVQAVGAGEPITLTINQQGFEVPLEDFALNRVRASAALDLGTLRMNNGGLLRLILQAFNRREAGQLTASFTPMNMALAEGQLTYDNMVMTLGNIVLGFRGLVNLNTDHVNLTMSMPGEALTKIFQDFEGVIGPDYQLEVPLTGPISSPQLNTGAITQEIARLALRAGIQKNLDGETGEAVGGLLDILTGKGSRSQPPANQQGQQNQQNQQGDQTQPREEKPARQRDPLGGLRDIFRPPTKDEPAREEK